jgi:hypothetical protein
MFLLISFKTIIIKINNIPQMANKIEKHIVERKLQILLIFKAMIHMRTQTYIEIN